MKRVRVSWLTGSALGVLAALVLFPFTRWLLFGQIGMALPVRSTPILAMLDASGDRRGIPALAAASRTTARRAPDDLAMQIADATQALSPFGTSGQFDESHVRRLRALLGPFSREPALYAAILDAEAPEIVLPGDLQQVGANRPPGRPLDPRVSDFAGIAAAGERLDPENAFFPAMQAAALFRTGQYEKAVRAVQRAGADSRWSAYTDVSMTGAWRIADSLACGRSGLVRVAVRWTGVLQHYATLRAVARAAIAEAIRNERAGDADSGYRLRMAIIRFGELMRSRGADALDALVGIAIASLAIDRPGGAPPITYRPHEAGTPAGAIRVQTQRQRAFLAYITRIGHDDVVAATEESFQRQQISRDIINRALETKRLGVDWSGLSSWWVADLILLSGIIWTLGLGSLAASLARTAWVRAGKPLQADVRLHALAGLGVVMAVAVAFLLGQPWRSDLILAAMTLVIGMPLLTGNRNWRQRSRAFASAAAACLPMGMAFAWQPRTIWPFLRTIENVGFGYPQADQPFWVHAHAELIFAAPVLLVLVVAGLSVVFGVPLCVGVARGVRGLALPVASVLVFAYAALLVGTMRAEANTDAVVRRSVIHECDYFATLVGTSWPR